jgi:hypothetical protein
MTDAQVWWGWFCTGVGLIYLALVVLAYLAKTSPRCLALGHKFTFRLGDYQYDSGFCRRCGFKP